MLKKVEEQKRKFPEGTWVKLVKKMDDKLAVHMVAGLTGFIRKVDDVGTLHVLWENGSTLGIPMEKIDEIEIIKDQKVFSIDVERVHDLQSFIADAWASFGIEIKVKKVIENSIFMFSESENLEDLVDNPGLQSYGIKKVHLF